MIELSPIKDETKSVDTCSTTTNVSTKEPSFVVVMWKWFCDKSFIEFLDSKIFQK